MINYWINKIRLNYEISNMKMNKNKWKWIFIIIKTSSNYSDSIPMLIKIIFRNTIKILKILILIIWCSDVISMKLNFIPIFYVIIIAQIKQALQIYYKSLFDCQFNINRNVRRIFRKKCIFMKITRYNIVIIVPMNFLKPSMLELFRILTSLLFIFIILLLFYELNYKNGLCVGIGEQVYSKIIKLSELLARYSSWNDNKFLILV